MTSADPAITGENGGRPTIRDVARLAGVSISTVSRVISGAGSVKPETSARITAAIRDLDFVPNAAARSLGGHTVRTTTAIADSLGIDSFMHLADGVEREVTAAGDVFSVINTRGSLDFERRAVESVREQQSRSVIFLGSAPIDDGYQERFAYYKQILDEVGTRMVFFARPSILGIPTIDARNEDAGALLARHLLSLGHRDLAFVGSGAGSTSLQRVAGVRAEMVRQGLDPDRLLLVDGPFTPSGGDQGTEELLNAGKRFTAMIAATDLVAVGAITALRRRGLRVPDDVSVVGVDGIELGASLSPALTTVRVPYAEFGRAVGRLALGLDQPERGLDLSPRLVVRSSSDWVPSGDEKMRGGGALALTVDARVAGVPFESPTRLVIGAGPASTAVRADWQTALQTVAVDLGIGAVRLEVAVPDECGYELDPVLDLLVDKGLRPWLALRGAGAQWPADLSAALTGWTARHGHDELRRWRFEVCVDTVAEYEAAVEAVRAVDDQYQVGCDISAAHSAGGRPDAAFLTLDADRAARAGVPGSVPEVIRDWTPPGGALGSLGDALDLISAAVNSRGRHLAMTRLIDAPGGDEANRGVVTRRGPVRPVWHALRMINALGSQVLTSRGTTIATRRDDGTVAMLAWHPATSDAAPQDAALELDVSGLPPLAIIDVEVVTRGHGDLATAWLNMGAPQRPTPQQLRTLELEARATRRLTMRADNLGRCREVLDLAPGSFVFLGQRS